jgi:hypothetical protein
MSNQVVSNFSLNFEEESYLNFENEFECLLISQQKNFSKKTKLFSLKINQVNTMSATGNSFDLKEKNQELLEKRNENIQRDL